MNLVTADINVGDLITGIDRSYERSIYKVGRIVGGKAILALPISLGGYVFRDSQRLHQIGTVEQFRLATEEEIEISSTGPMQWDVRSKWLKELNHPSFP